MTLGSFLCVITQSDYSRSLSLAPQAEKVEAQTCTSAYYYYRMTIILYCYICFEKRVLRPVWTGPDSPRAFSAALSIYWCIYTLHMVTSVCTSTWVPILYIELQLLLRLRLLMAPGKMHVRTRDWNESQRPAASAGAHVNWFRTLSGLWGCRNCRFVCAL